MNFNEKIKCVRENRKLNQAQFAQELGVTQAAISKYERTDRLPDTNFINAMIEKLNLNPTWFFLNKGAMFLDESLFEKARQLAEKNQREDELTELLQGFIDKQMTVDLIQKLQMIKGRTILEKLSEAWTGTGTRMLRVLYYFLEHLEKEKIEFGKDAKDKFIKALQSFEVPKKEKKKFLYAIYKEDKKALVQWCEQELDDLAVLEITKSLANLCEQTKNQMNSFDKFLIDLRL